MLKEFFRDRINYCEPIDSKGRLKADSRSALAERFWEVYWFLLQYPKPYDNPCWCCAGLRGIILGGIAGLAIGYAGGKLL